MKKHLNEYMSYTGDKLGAIITGDDNVPRTLKTFAQAYNRKKFDEIMRKSGVAREWMSRHPNLGYYVKHKDINKEPLDRKNAILQARARWMGDESWYEEDNYFWIKLDEFDKPLICQLRVSNHNASHEQYETSHSLNKAVNCQTCLNVVIGDKPLNRKPFMPAKNNDAIIVVETLYNEKERTQNQIDFFENFIDELTSGKQPLLTIDDIRKNIDPNPRIVISQGGITIRSIDASVRDDQYTPRENIFKNRVKPRDFDPPVEKNIITAIKFNDVLNNLTKQTITSKKYNKERPMEIFTLNGDRYAFDESTSGNGCFGHAIKLKKSGVVSNETPIKIIENKQYNRNVRQKIRLTESDLHDIIEESVKTILSKLSKKRNNGRLRRFG